MLENTKRKIKNGQSRETGNIGYSQEEEKQNKTTTQCVGHHYTQIMWSYGKKLCIIHSGLIQRIGNMIYQQEVYSSMI